jgi:hypothetical protein
MARSEILTKARTEIEVDGKSAEQVLAELKAKAEQYTRAMVDAQKANDKVGFDKAKKSANEYNSAVKTIEKSTADVNAVMKNLSGATMKELLAAKRKLTEQMKGMARGTEEYARKSKQLQSVNKELGKVRTEMSGVAGANQGMIGKMRSGFMWMAGAVGSAMALWRGFTSTLKTTQSGGDALERTLQGVKGATTALQQTIAQGDWSNLISNMRKGYEAASNYATALDELADRTRAVDVRTDEQKSELEELRNTMASVETATIEERQRAQDRYMELNREILEATKKNADLMINAEKNRLKQQYNLTDESVELLVDYVRNYDILSDRELKNIQRVLDAEQKVAEEKKKVYMGSLSDNIKAATGQNKVLEELKGNAETEKEMLNEKELAYYNLSQTIDRFIDDQRDDVAKALKSVSAANTQYENLQRNAVRRQQALEREKKQRDADAQKAELEALEQHHQQILLEIDRAYLEEHRNADIHNQQLETAEWAHILARIAIYKQFGLDTTDLERKRVEQQIRAMEEFKRAQLAISDEMVAKNIADTDAALLAQFAAWDEEDAVKEKRRLGDEEYEAKRLESYVQRMEQYRNVTDQMAASVGALIGQMATDAEMTTKDMAKQILLIALDSAHAVARIAIAEIWARSLKREDSVASFGAVGVLRALVISALVESAFAGLKASINKVGQRFVGKYDVIGEDDGRIYRNVPYQGDMRTGIYGKPTLVAERGPELIVDHGTLRNVQVNFPDVLPKIRASMVPQRATGNVAERIASPAPSSEMTSILANNNKALNDNTALMATLSQQLDAGISANIHYAKIEDANNKVQKIRKDVSRK